MANKPRRPCIAASLTLITPGLGHLYTGEPKRGIIIFGIGEAFLVVFAILLIIVKPSLYFLIIALICGFALTAFFVIDAVSIARRKDSYELAKYNRWYAYIGYFVVLSMVISSPLSGLIKTNLVRAYKVPSGAMIPTLLIGDQIIANRYIYKTSEPRRGDIIVYPYPKEPSRIFVKRLIAMEGDIVKIRNKRLYLNGKEQIEPYIITSGSGHIEDTRDNFGPATVPSGMLFFMGDNRDESYDSRFYGFVPRKTISGKAISVYWSWDAVSHTVRWDRIGKLLK
jgi:signal peptidase I